MNSVVDLSSRRKPLAIEPLPALLTLAPNDRILRMKTVRDRVGLSRATIYRRIKCKEFPESVPLGSSAVGWRESDINAWIAALGQGGDDNDGGAA